MRGNLSNHRERRRAGKPIRCWARLVEHQTKRELLDLRRIRVGHLGAKISQKARQRYAIEAFLHHLKKTTLIV